MIVIFNSCFDTRCFELTHRPTKTRGVEVCRLSWKKIVHAISPFSHSRAKSHPKFDGLNQPGMSVTEVVIVRHAHRQTWIVDTIDREYRAAQLNPTGIATDPALTEHGIKQSEEVGVAMEKLLRQSQSGHRIAIFSSPFYRCLQTIAPTIARMRRHGWGGFVHIEAGFGEWFGTAPFNHPAPLDPANMHAKFFDFVHPTYQSQAQAPSGPEPYQDLRRRVQKALQSSISKIEADAVAEGKKADKITLVIVCHTAPIIMLGRCLTNSWPVDMGTDEFKCFLAGISKYQRCETRATMTTTPSDHPITDSQVAWWQGREGHPERWEASMNSDCSHLSAGPEGGWHFGSEQVQDQRIVRGEDGHRMFTNNFKLE